MTIFFVLSLLIFPTTPSLYRRSLKSPLIPRAVICKNITHPPIFFPQNLGIARRETTDSFPGGLQERIIQNVAKMFNLFPFLSGAKLRTLQFLATLLRLWCVERYHLSIIKRTRFSSYHRSLCSYRQFVRY